MANKPTEEDEFEFHWIQARKEAGLEGYDQETSGGKFMRKLRSNPFVPIGCLLTTTCLVLGLRTMQTGNMKRGQLMMRGRILAQGFTVVALVAGIGYSAVKDV